MKQLLGVDAAGTYTFDKTAKTVTFSGLSQTITLSNILLINNATASQIIYNFADPSSGAISFTNNVLTLDFDTTAMSNSDVLQIWLDMPQQTELITKDRNSADSLLFRIYSLLAAPLGYDKSLARQRSTAVIESGTVTTVTTVTTVSNMTQFSGYSTVQQVYDTSKMAWADTVRNRIT